MSKRRPQPRRWVVNHYTRGDRAYHWHGITQTDIREMGRPRYLANLTMAETYARRFIEGARHRRATIEYLPHPSDGQFEVLPRRRTIRRRP